jgi:hypothetical protein
MVIRIIKMSHIDLVVEVLHDRIFSNEIIMEEVTRRMKMRTNSEMAVKTLHLTNKLKISRRQIWTILVMKYMFIISLFSAQQIKLSTNLETVVQY